MTTHLYTSDDLLDGYDRKKPASFTETRDYKLYRSYYAAGRDAPQDIDVGLKQAKHDTEISTALAAFLHNDDKMVAIMGGHSLSRSMSAYQLIANIARILTQKGFLIVTGGGPGAMEAAHLGAYFERAPDEVFQKALDRLADPNTAALPRGLDDVVSKDGSIVPNSSAVIGQASDWLNTALEARDLWRQDEAGRSVAVPTWLYGSEPTTPFATAYAKYYQNSIREERLVSQGKIGTIYAQGEGGTLREIYQGVEQNYYVKTQEKFKPMIFVDPNHYWERDAEYDADGLLKVKAIKVDEGLRKVFRINSNVPPEVWKDRLRFSTDIGVIADVLLRYADVAPKTLRLMKLGLI